MQELTLFTINVEKSLLHRGFATILSEKKQLIWRKSNHTYEHLCLNRRNCRDYHP